jgi:hypothetical protein
VLIFLDRAGCKSYVGGEGEAKEASLAAEYGPGKSVAVLFDKPLGQEPLAPSHISFLNEQSNDAMVQFLSSLIPVARFLEVPGPWLFPSLESNRRLLCVCTLLFC